MARARPPNRGRAQKTGGAGQQISTSQKGLLGESGDARRAGAPPFNAIRARKRMTNALGSGSSVEIADADCSPSRCKLTGCFDDAARRPAPPRDIVCASPPPADALTRCGSRSAEATSPPGAWPLMTMVAPSCLTISNKRRGVPRRQPHAAVRGDSAEAADRVSAVDRVSAGEEDRMRHRRIVVLVRVRHHVHALRMIDAGRRAVTGPAGGDGPIVVGAARRGHVHGLRAEIDVDVHGRLRGRLSAYNAAPAIIGAKMKRMVNPSRPDRARSRQNGAGSAGIAIRSPGLQ